MELKCPKCSTDEPMFSKKRQVYVCDSCGHEFKLEESFMAQRIFISYGHDEHAPLAMRLRDDLRQRGHEAWFDEEHLQPGADWESRIEEGLSWAAEGKPQASFILLLTPHSVRRPDGFCLNEVARALTLKLRIIPLMVVESEPPLSICRIQWLDMRECIPIHEKEPLYKTRFQRLLTALERNELDYQGVQSRLLNLLKPVEFSADLLKLLRDFTGRQWVFEEIDAWFKNPAGVKVFWLTGSPGVGKSAIAAWVRENRREVAAFHFCDINSEEKRNPGRLVCSIAYQLSTQLPEYQRRLSMLDLENIVKEYHEAYTLFDLLLVQPLTDNFPEPDRTIVVLIDALDEATNRRRNEIVRFLSRSADKTPSWLRFLVTSRPEPEITASFQALSPYVLDTGKAENLTDLRKYIRKKIPEITPAETEAIISRSEGVFLYVQYVVENILTKTLDLHNIDQFPRGLGDVYHQFFERQFGEDLSYYENNIVPLLQPVLAAFEPLTKDQLKSLCSITEDTELERRLNRLGSLFPTGGQGECETIRPFHRSLSDWITDRRSAGHFVIAKADGHRILAGHCWNEYQKGVDTLSPYSLLFLPAHLVATQRWDDLIGDDTTPGLLTDLRFIQAKCEAELVFDLILDYNLALAELPEFKEEQEYLFEHDIAMRAYNKKLNEYAIKRYDYLQMLEKGEASLEPQYPELPAILHEEKRLLLPEESSPRAARLRYFSNFVSHCISPLATFPGETFSYAYNYAQEGPVSTQAEMLMESYIKPWLRRILRPAAHPARPECLRTLDGHSRSINCVVISSDGRNVVTASHDKTLRVWDLETGACLIVLEGHTASVRSCAFSPDGHLIISFGIDKTIRIWDFENGDCLHIIETDDFNVNSICFTIDGFNFITGNSDNIIRVWDLNTCRCIRTMEGHFNSVSSVAVTPDGHRIISGSLDKTLRIWDIHTGECIKTMEGHSANINSVSVTPDGLYAVSGGWDKTLRVWDLNAGTCLITMGKNDGWVNSVAVTPDCRYVVSGSWNKKLQVWDIVSGDIQTILEGHSRCVNSVIVTPNGRYALSGSNDKTLRIWNLEKITTSMEFIECHNLSINSVVATNNSRYVISGSEDTTLRIWSLENNSCLNILEGHSGSIKSVKITPDGHYAVSGSLDNTLRVWDLETGTCVQVIDGYDGWLNNTCITPDGCSVISSNIDGVLRVWDLKTGACLNTMQGDSFNTNSICITPDCNRIVSGSLDNLLRIWDLETGTCLHSLKGHNNLIWSLCVTPDGYKAISGCFDNILRIWDVETGKCMHTLEGHNDMIWCVSVTSDNHFVVSGSLDKTLRVWDIVTGSCVHIMEGHGGNINSVSLTPDGLYAVSGSRDKTIQIWELKSGENLTLYNVDAPVGPVTFSSCGKYVICGDDDGRIHFFQLVNFPPPMPAIITALESGKGRCYYCAREFKLSGEIVTIIQNGPKTDSEHSKLVVNCPYCNKPLQINRFFAKIYKSG